LESEHDLRRDVASRFVLSGKGAMRGWTRPSVPPVTVDQLPPREIVIKWLDEDESDPRDVSEGSRALIDATPVEGDERSSEQVLQRNSRWGAPRPCEKRSSASSCRREHEGSSPFRPFQG
jgi:hypothetical protein